MPSDRLLRRAYRERFLVTCIDEDAIEGVLIDSDAHHVVLAAADVIAKNGDRMRLDTEIWLPRHRIKYIQAVRP